MSTPASRRHLGQPCHYCGAVADTADHVIPKALGGTDGQWNLVPACWSCNHAKGDALPTCGCDFCAAALRWSRNRRRRWRKRELRRARKLAA